MAELTLFDLPSKGRNATWSYNPWKTRLVLNFKGLDYKTTWVEYPDLEATFSPHLQRNSPPDAPYTIPTMKFGDEYVTDSEAINTRLEKEHPTPSLQMDSPLVPLVSNLMPKIMMPIRPVWLPLVAQNILNPRSKEWFEHSRSEKLGKSLTEFQAESGGEEAWMEALTAFKAMAELLKREGGPFFLGETVSYADFLLLARLKFWRRIDEGIYNRIVQIDPAFEKLYEAGKQWLERDDH